MNTDMRANFRRQLIRIALVYLALLALTAFLIISLLTDWPQSLHRKVPASLPCQIIIFTQNSN